MRGKQPHDLTGRIFGRLTVTGYSRSNRNGPRWNCRCICGTTKEAPAKGLRNGNIQSCGCLQREAGQKTRTHGMSFSLTYRSWAGMIERCERAAHRSYHRYGGRGIRVCAAWRANFEVFFKDMGERPNKEYSIDRYPNPDGNYEPGNCRWATMKEQANNRSRIGRS